MSEGTSSAERVQASTFLITLQFLSLVVEGLPVDEFYKIYHFLHQLGR